MYGYHSSQPIVIRQMVTMFTLETLLVVGDAKTMERPQGSVMSASFFNVYNNDLPET